MVLFRFGYRIAHFFGYCKHFLAESGATSIDSAIYDTIHSHFSLNVVNILKTASVLFSMSMLYI